MSSSTQHTPVLDVTITFDPPGSSADNPIIIDSNSDDESNIFVPYVRQPSNRHRRVCLQPIPFPNLIDEIEPIQIHREIVPVSVQPEAHHVLLDENVGAVPVENEDVIIISSDEEYDSDMSSLSIVEDM